MDKSKLFYLVMKGTNIQVVSRHTKKIIIVQSDAIDRVAKEYPEYEKISVEDFEEQFVDNKDDDKDE